MKECSGSFQQILAFASSYTWKPYLRWGVDDAWFDCSWLWYFVLGKYGVDFPSRYTSSRFYQECQLIARENVQVGDFMFWHRKPGEKKHNALFHIEIVVERPFQRYGRWYVKTFGSATTKKRYDAQGNVYTWWGVGYRFRLVSPYRSFWRFCMYTSDS